MHVGTMTSAKPAKQLNARPPEMCERGHCCICACPQVCSRRSAARNVIVGGLLPGWFSAFYGQHRH